MPPARAEGRCRWPSSTPPASDAARHRLCPTCFQGTRGASRRAPRPEPRPPCAACWHERSRRVPGSPPGLGPEVLGRGLTGGGTECQLVAIETPAEREPPARRPVHRALRGDASRLLDRPLEHVTADGVGPDDERVRGGPVARPYIEVPAVESRRQRPVVL